MSSLTLQCKAGIECRQGIVHFIQQLGFRFFFSKRGGPVQCGNEVSRLGVDYYLSLESLRSPFIGTPSQVGQVVKNIACGNYSVFLWVVRLVR
jgi:hypothetical protein